VERRKGGWTKPVAWVKVVALRGGGSNARRRVESGGSGQGGFRLAEVWTAGTRPVSGVVRRPMESSRGAGRSVADAPRRVNVKRATVTER
jgi:hypothetical protein